jgi:hypothetical protein
MSQKVTATSDESDNGRWKHLNFSKVVHGEAEFGAREDIDLGSLCCKYHYPKI